MENLLQNIASGLWSVLCVFCFFYGECREGKDG